MAKELNLKIKPGTDIYKVKIGDQEVEVVIMMALDRGMYLVEALHGEPFDRSSYFGCSYMTCQGVVWKGALQFSRKWE